MKIIGIVSCPIPSPQPNKPESYIYQNYLNWIQLSGMNFRIIPYNVAPPVLDRMLASVSGMVWCGGCIEDRKTHTDRQYHDLVRTYSHSFQYAVRENDEGRPFPIWGSCLGFLFLAMLAEGIDHAFFSHIQHAFKHSSAPVVFTGRSRLRSVFPKSVQEWMAHTPVAYHIHQYGFKEDSPHTARLKKFLRVVSYDTTKEGRIVNMYEFLHYPFYGSQWHPEQPKNEGALEVSRRLSEFLKAQCTDRPPPPLERVVPSVLIN